MKYFPPTVMTKAMNYLAGILANPREQNAIKPIWQEPLMLLLLEEFLREGQISSQKKIS